jgi:hypothetical protein
MVNRVIWGAIFIITFTTITKSQVPIGKTVLQDTINETIVYEYDTVYLAPDTIRLTDTIVNYTKPKVTPKKTRSRIFRFFSSYSIFSNFTPSSLELKVSPFAYENFINKQFIDSSENKTGINLSYLVQLNYNIRKFVISASFGFTPFQEKYSFKDSYYSDTRQAGSNESYDSILVYRNNTYVNYYNYLNLSLSFGRTWNISKKIFFKVNISGHSDVLIGHSANVIGDSIKLSSSSARSIDFSVSISPYIGYKINKTLGIFISPFYQHSLAETDKYPRYTFQKAGIGAGLTFSL